jgi:hypothetical protein
MTSTTKLGDWLGRALVNDNPGTSNAEDFLGRGTIASDKDFLGRALTDTPLYPPADWQASHAYVVGAQVKIPGTKEVQTLTGTGTPVGNFRLAVDKDGQTLTTANIATVSQANIQAALVALDNVDPGDVTVGGSGPWTLTWQEELGNVPQVSAVNTDVTGGSYAVTTTTQGAALGAILEATAAGTSNSTKPTAPAVGATVVDSGVTWKRLK